jgi:hypothetical protein
LVFVDSTFAQRKIEVEEANVIGEVARISPLSLTVKTALGPYEVDIVNREFNNLGPAHIEVKGDKPLKYLQRGMTVRIEGIVENGRKVRDPISEVIVLDPAAVVALGGGAIRRNAEGRRPDAAEDGGEVSEVIVGTVRIFRSNVLSIEVPGERKATTLQAKLADDAVVKISFGSLSAARPGDKVQVKGWREVGGRGKRIWAEEVTVTSTDEPADTRVARGGKANPAGPRRAFGDVGSEEPKEDGAGADKVEYEGNIVEIN